MKRLDATIAIPTLNAEKEGYWREVIEACLAQKTNKTFELLVVDTGSSDETVTILKSFKDDRIRLVEIPNSEFGHGKTRNYLAQIAKGDIMLYLTQDATPAHPKWLDEMLFPFSLNDTVAAVYGKQIPRPDCMPLNKRDIINYFNSFGPDGSLMLHYHDKLVEGFPPTVEFFSDVNSAVRRSVLLGDVPYRDVSYAEDQYLGRDVLAAGYIKAYAPYGSVVHSHSYPLEKYFRRMIDEYIALKKVHPDMRLVTTKELLWGTLKATVADLGFIWRDRDYAPKAKLKWLLLCGPYNVARRLAGHIADSPTLAAKIHKKASLTSKVRSQAKKE